MTTILWVDLLICLKTPKKKQGNKLLCPELIFNLHQNNIDAPENSKK